MSHLGGFWETERGQKAKKWGILPHWPGLGTAQLQGTSFTSVEQLWQAIDHFVARYNQTATAFEWTKRFVKPRQLKHRYAD